MVIDKIDFVAEYMRMAEQWFSIMQLNRGDKIRFFVAQTQALLCCHKARMEAGLPPRTK